MEDVSEVYYKRPSDPERPVGCLDKTRQRRIGETRTPIPAAPERIDTEYERHGTANWLMQFEPLAGGRRVEGD